MRSVKNIFACFLALLIVSSACVTAFAVEPSVEAGAQYKASGFYDRLLEVELTGDQRYDSVAIAVSQLGYHEGNSEAEMDGLNGKGNRNFAEYTRVWGKVDNQEGNGVSYGYAWCAAFVSWCLRQARVPKEIALTEISCSRMTNWYVRRELYHSRESGYTPILGDIIMFADENSPSHVGLVLGVKDGRVYTIEGNGGECVATHSYSLTSTYVYGYCVPQYTVTEGLDYGALMEKALNPLGNYIVTAKTVNVLAEADSASETLGSLNTGDTVKVTGFDGKWNKIEYDAGEAWVQASALTYEKYMVYTIKYNLKGGKSTVEEQHKMLGYSVKLGIEKPQKSGYTFKGWSTDKSAKTVDYEYGAEYTADESITLFAVWEPRQLTVTYYNYDGTVYQEFICNYNDWLVQPETPPAKPNDEQYSYTFSGWNKELDQIVVRNLEYSPVFTETPLPPEEDKESEEWMLIALIASGVAVLGVAIAVCLIIRKKKKTDK